MAESQYLFEYDAIKETSIKGTLSPERIGRYLTRAGFDFSFAMDLYLWNARLAKSLQFPIHALEVTLRNAVNHHLLLTKFPNEWAFHTPSLDKLGAAKPDLIASLNKSKSRLLWGKMSSADHHTTVIAPNHRYIPSFNLISTSDVIASMSLEFWSSMVDREFEYEWRPTYSIVFPNSAAGEYRKGLWKKLQPIKDLRNRISHHEPLLDKTDLPTLHTQILDIVYNRCSMTMAWTKSHSTFARTWHDVPQRTRKTGKLLTEVASPVSGVTALDTQVSDVIGQMTGAKRRDALIYRVSGNLGLLVADDVMRWFSATAHDGLVELRKTLEDIIQLQPPRSRLAIVGPSATTGDARLLFFEPGAKANARPTAIVITADGTHSGLPLGLVFRPDYLS